MSDDTAGNFLNESRHVSVWVDVTAREAYEFVSDPANLPSWAAGLDLTEVAVEFAPTNGFGVVDHVVRLGGEALYNPMRIIAPMTGERPCEVVFSVRRRPGMTDDEFDADAVAVIADLRTLRGLLES